MEEKNATKISLSTFFLILAIIVIVIMAYFIYKISNEKTMETEKVANLNNEVSSLQNTVNSLNEKINSVSNIVNNSNTQSTNISNNNTITNLNNNSNYIELNEDNFNKYYNNDKYLLNIQTAVDNGDGTVTLKEDVYEKYIKGDEKELEGDEPVAHYKKTGIIMHITLNQNFKCKYESVSETEEKSLKEISEEYKNKSDEDEIVEDDDIRSVVSDKFIFNNGKCTEIIFYVPR